MFEKVECQNTNSQQLLWWEKNTYSVLLRLFFPSPVCLIQTLLLLSMSHWFKTPTSSHTSVLLLLYSPILFDLTTLSLFPRTSSPSCTNSTKDVHEAQFTTWALSIISPVNWLTVPAAPLHHLFMETGLGSPSVLGPLTPSLHHADTQPLWQIIPICFSVQRGACVKFPGTYYPCTYTEIRPNNIRTKQMDLSSTLHGWLLLFALAGISENLSYFFPSVLRKVFRSQTQINSMLFYVKSTPLVFP